MSSPETVLALLEFVGTEKSRSLGACIEHLGRPKSTVLRLLDMLVQSGFVCRLAPGEYAVTLKPWRLGCQALNFGNIARDVVPVLKLVAANTGESALYAVYEGGFSVYVEKVDSPQPVAAFVTIGSRAPAYATATGKVLLAHQPQAEIDRVIAGAGAHTRHTITGAAALLRELGAVRERGVAFTHGEWREDVAGVAAPVFDRSNKVIACIGITCPKSRVAEKLDALGREVQAVARDLSFRLGAAR